MRKINYLFITIIIAAAMGFASCESTDQEIKSGKNTTFVVTKPDPADGKIYSVMVFNEITEITATYMRTNEKYEIPVENCTYDSTTTSIIINKPRDIPHQVKDLVFTITGVPAFPAEFILHNGIYKNVDPGVFINGTKAVLGTDYTFNKKTHHLAFITPVDSDKDSYEIIWLNPNGTSAMSNNLEKYQAQFKKLESQWFRSIK